MAMIAIVNKIREVYIDNDTEENMRFERIYIPLTVFDQKHWAMICIYNDARKGDKMIDGGCQLTVRWGDFFLSSANAALMQTVIGMLRKGLPRFYLTKKSGSNWMASQEV